MVAAVAPPPPKPTAPQRVKQGGNVTAASILQQTRPLYPALARQARIQGNVVLHAIIDKDGAPLGRAFWNPASTIALRIVTHDPEEERADEAGSVATHETVHRDASLRRAGHRTDSAREVAVEALQHVEVGDTDVRVEGAVHGVEVDVDHPDRASRAWAIGGELVGAAQIDDRADAVVEQRLPAGRREMAEVVGADDRAVPRLAAVLGRQAAEIADVHAAVPGERPQRSSTS